MGLRPSCFAIIGSLPRQFWARIFLTPNCMGISRRSRVFHRTPLITAGFPCTDLSQVGRTAGIKGESGLVSHVFRLVKSNNVVGLSWECGK